MDRQSSDILRRYGIPAQGSADTSGLKEEVKALREEIRSGLFAVAKNTQKTAQKLETWDGDGMPGTRDADTVTTSVTLLAA